MSAMTPEEVRLECLSLAVECREARHSAADVVALAAAFECFVNLPAAPVGMKASAAPIGKAPARKAAKAVAALAEDGQ
jgi:hypothetical protein